MDTKTLKLSALQIGVLRSILLISTTIAFYCVVRAFFIEIYAPGKGALSIYNDAAYAFMGVAFIFSIPLWIIKLQKISAYQNELNAKYGDNEEARNSHINLLVFNAIKRNLPQIVIACVIAGIIYFVLTQYYVTPEVQAEYLRQAKEHQLILYNTSNISIIETNISLLGTP